MRSNISRRNFLGNVSLGAGAFGINSQLLQPQEIKPVANYPRQVIIGTVSLTHIFARDTKEMIEKVLAVMDNIVPYHPDIICLPEVFAYSNIEDQNYKLNEAAENASAVTKPFAEFAAKHKCYVICPTYVRSKGNIYIAGVLIDRNGKVVGEYHKMHPAESELQMGIKPGRANPPVFQTDFGKIGIQICFDVKYDDGWNYLKDNGAQIIFWPSAYAAGQEICSRAWRHKVYIVTSTLKDTSRICDITGEAIVQTGRWQPDWAVASVNLEKAFVLTWPAVKIFADIQKKYASRIKITTYNEEEWTIIESLDTGLKITDVLKEYNLKTAHAFEKDLSVLYEGMREKE